MNQISRKDQDLIVSWVESGASVLDLGCGDGTLLTRLLTEKQVRAQGIELNEHATHTCVAAGLNVFQQDIDTGLSEYDDGSFDYVILNQTFQQVKKPAFVLEEALRAGKHAIVGFPNFCHYANRLQIVLRGTVPVASSLPYQWYETPNLHFLSITDFWVFCKKREIKVEKAAFLSSNGKLIKVWPNVFGEVALFLLTKDVMQ